jgi:hypothetical protein
MIDNYEKLGPGHWYQKRLTGPLPDYSSNYSKERYDTYNTNLAMSELRYSIINDYVGDFNSILDVGYGNGSFLQYCNNENKKTYGYDISDYPPPENTEKTNKPSDVNVDVITFFDSLEHILERDLVPFLKSLNTKYIVVSIPWFHESLGPEYFKTWKHRRENEHIHHFDVVGLVNLLNTSNFQVVHLGNEEDKIRKSVNHLPNILTVVARKVKK